MSFNRGKRVLIGILLPLSLFFCFSCEEPVETFSSDNTILGKTVNLENVKFEKGIYGGTLYDSTSSDPKTFNPVFAHETSSTVAVAGIFEGLTDVDIKTLKPAGRLAVSWEFKDNGTTWVFHLRKDVRWSDGKPFTADDVVFTYNKIYFNPEYPNSVKDMFEIDGKLPKIKKLDTYTVEIKLPQPFAPLLYSLSADIFPEHLLREIVESGKFKTFWTVATSPEKLVGTGPYKLVKYVNGQYLVYEKNPFYYESDGYGSKLPYVEKKVIYIVPQKDTALLKFKNKELDFYGLSGDDFPSLKKGEKNGNYTIYNLGPSLTADFICFNQKREVLPEWKLKLFSNATFRRAISHAVDRKGIVLTVYNGLGFPVYYPVTKANKLYYDPEAPKFPYDLEKAKELLESIGLKDRNGDGWLETPDGHKVEFSLLTNSNNPNRVQIGSILKFDLKRLGIDVHFQPLDFNNLVEKLLNTHDFDAVIIGLTGSIDPNGGKNVWKSSGQLHLWNPNQKRPATQWEAEIDRLFDEGVKELDFKKRVEIYKRAYRIIAKEQPVIYIAAPLVFEAVRNRVKNYFPTIWGTYKPTRIFIKE
ncbi:ABC transporter substrate-binding protein [Desulfurobacterium atlanticum]|nr:ABC transporter substrate-binding protein [Desulfurobacterium atlanticum]